MAEALVDLVLVLGLGQDGFQFVFDAGTLPEHREEVLFFEKDVIALAPLDQWQGLANVARPVVVWQAVGDVFQDGAKPELHREFAFEDFQRPQQTVTAGLKPAGVVLVAHCRGLFVELGFRHVLPALYCLVGAFGAVGREVAFG